MLGNEILEALKKEAQEYGDNNVSYDETVKAMVVRQRLEILALGSDIAIKVLAACNDIESLYLEMSKWIKPEEYVETLPLVEVRSDCEEFSPKNNSWERGSCETDGHYLCRKCKHIAPFHLMSVWDNKEKYYPKDAQIQILKWEIEEKDKQLNNEWVDVDDADTIIEVNPECNSCSKTMLAENAKGEQFLVYAICENDEGRWTTSIFCDIEREDTWYTDIVKLKKIQ